MFTVAELLSYCVTGAARKQLYRDLPTIVQLDFHLHRGKTDRTKTRSWCALGAAPEDIVVSCR